MARKGLPKKYAKMGFKRGWKAYKASKRRPSSRKVYARPKRRYTRARSPGKIHKRYGKKLGAIINGFRYVDVISAPFQGSLQNHGLTKDAITAARQRYMSGDNNYAAHKGIATGIGYNIIKGKLGVNRGVGKGKILSYLAAFSPELLAMGDVEDPLNNWKAVNEARHRYHSGYSIGNDVHDLSPNSGEGQAFWGDKSLTAGLILAQKLVFNTSGPIGLNKYLPKGINF